MINMLGELAGLATAVFFAASSTVNTIAGRQVGSVILNRSRLVMAIFWLLLAHWIFQLPLPLYASKERLFWLSISGIIGLAIGDAFLFQAFIWIGARLSMLLMALAPILSALLAIVFLGEALTLRQWLGMILAILGVVWVIFDRNGGNQINKKYYIPGILCGLGAAVGQSLGLVLAKRGMAGDFPALSGALVRMLAATVVIWGIALFQRQAGATVSLLINRPRATLLILLGAFLGPFMGVTLSLYSVQHAEVGVASTLIALPPIFLLPVGYFYFKERFGWASVFGTLVAMAGVALLFMA